MSDFGDSPTLLVAEDDAALREALVDTLQLNGYRVTAVADGRSALQVLAEQTVHMIISDVQMDGMDGNELLRTVCRHYPDIPVLMMTAYGTIEHAVQAMHDGAVDYLAKPFAADSLVEKVERFLPRHAAADVEMVAEDPRTREITALARRVAGSDATVMITGESGTGKEVLARYIHRHSSRHEQPFVAINCAAIPENMLEATLFGYEKGAFTGAHQARPGKFEQAQGGTLLLDEISEMALELQAKLLRVLQEREVERLGGRKTIALDVRILATSNRLMREEVAAGRFREDLFYRLNVFPIEIPPLRERAGDILPLVEAMLVRGARRDGVPVPALSDGARRRLESHGWPGNVRELDNLIQRALILHSNGVIDVDDLHFEQLHTASAPAEAAAVPGSDTDSLGQDLKSREQALILNALREENGSRKKAAEKLGISQRTLRYKLARMREAGIAIPGGVSA